MDCWAVIKVTPQPFLGLSTSGICFRSLQFSENRVFSSLVTLNLILAGAPTSEKMTSVFNSSHTSCPLASVSLSQSLIFSVVAWSGSEGWLVLSKIPPSQLSSPQDGQGPTCQVLFGSEVRTEDPKVSCEFRLFLRNFHHPTPANLCRQVTHETFHDCQQTPETENFVFAIFLQEPLRTT